MADTLPRLYLTDAPDRQEGKDARTIPGAEASDRIRVLYFSLSPDSGRVRVNYLASNLAVFLKPVPEAHAMVKRYAWLKIISPVLFSSGLVAIGATTGYHLYLEQSPDGNKNRPPRFLGVFVGIGLCISSGIPELLARGKIEDAVEVYNRHAGKTTP